MSANLSRISLIFFTSSSESFLAASPNAFLHLDIEIICLMIITFCAYGSKDIKLKLDNLKE